MANADGDGYTVLMHHIGMSTAPALYPNLAYKPLKELKHLDLVAPSRSPSWLAEDFKPTALRGRASPVRPTPTRWLPPTPGSVPPPQLSAAIC